MKSQQERLVNLTPDDTWGGAGLLGVTIRLDNYAGAEERLVRVLEVDSPQAPAAMAGLVPFHDYILGTTSETLQDTAQLGALLEEHVDQVVELYVYNSQSDLVRNVALMPTLSWGGRGLLGAAVGTGYLHRFPAKTQETTGASVERKVRYIGTVAPAPKSANSSSSSGPNNEQPQTQRIELEPQLEMEVVAMESDSEHDDVEPSATKSCASEQQVNSQPNEPPVSNLEGTGTEARSESLPTTDTTAALPPPASSSSNGNEPDSTTTAAALFAGPPPATVY